MSAYVKTAAVLLGLMLLVGVTYWWAVFSTSFNANMCYSEVISFIAEQAQSTAASKAEPDMTAFKEMIQELPLHGYETDCNEVLEATKQYRSAHGQGAQT